MKHERLEKKSQKQVGMPTQFIIFHLPLALEYQTWYRINA